MYNQFAKIALELITNVNVKATDNDLTLVLQTRQMLHGIANGSLVVGQPVEDEPQTPAAPGKARLKDVLVATKEPAK